MVLEFYRDSDVLRLALGPDTWPIGSGSGADPSTDRSRIPWCGNYSALVGGVRSVNGIYNYLKFEAVKFN